MNLEADLRADILAYLPAPDRDVATWLESMPTPRLLDCFLTLRDRLIHPHPRTVRNSAELRESPYFDSLEPDINALQQKIAHGADLAPHMSRRIGTSYMQAFRRPRDLDILLSEWNIHHLHLSARIGSDSYAARGNHVLFAIFKDEAAYLLDILPRAGWRVQRLAEIAVRNWPDSGLLHRLAGGVAVLRDRGRPRGGLNSPIIISGNCYVSNSYGIAAGGSPPHVTVAAMKLLSLIAYYGEHQQSLEREFMTANARYGIGLPLIPAFRLIIARTSRAYEFVIIEDRTSLMMSLGI